MNYLKHYGSLIERAKNRVMGGYSEKHHIIPKCLGGSDEKENLVILTAREHYVAHQLLVKIYPGNRKLAYAALMMSSDSVLLSRSTNRSYAWLRKRASESFKGSGNPMYGKPCPWQALGMDPPTKGIKWSEETKRKLSIAQTGKKFTKEHTENIRKSRLGTTASEETKSKMRESAVNRPNKYHSEETRKKMSDSMKLAWKNKKESSV